LIEIEESSASPKTLLGDVFGILLAEHIWFKDKTLEACEHASLIVVGKGNKSDEAMINHLNQQVESIRSMIGNDKIYVGRVVIGCFADDKGLEELLKNKIDEAHEC